MRCSSAVYSSIFSMGCPALREGLWMLHQISTWTDWNFTVTTYHRITHTVVWRRGRRAGRYSVVTDQGCARDLHALFASRPSLTSPPIGKNSWVLAAGTIEDFHTEEKSPRRVASPELRSRQTLS